MTRSRRSRSRGGARRAEKEQTAGWRDNAAREEETEERSRARRRHAKTGGGAGRTITGGGSKDGKDRRKWGEGSRKRLNDARRRDRWRRATARGREEAKGSWLAMREVRDCQARRCPSIFMAAASERGNSKTAPYGCGFRDVRALRATCSVP